VFIYMLPDQVALSAVRCVSSQLLVGSCEMQWLVLQQQLRERYLNPES